MDKLSNGLPMAARLNDNYPPMPATEIVASYFYTDNDGKTLVLGFADDRLDPQKFLMLQKALKPTPQDLRLGHDKIHVSINDERHSAYGGVQKVAVGPRCISFTVDSIAAGKLNSEGQIVVKLNSPEIDTERVFDLLVEIFGPELNIIRQD